MNKNKFKKIGIILAIIVVLVAAIFLIAKLFKGESVDNKTIEQYEDATIKYYLNLTAGLNTPYGGLEALYAADETKLEDLSERQLINTAISYLQYEGIVTAVDMGTLTLRYESKYPYVGKSTIYSAEEIKKAINTLFGIENFAKPTIKSDSIFLTTFEYLAEEDLYLVYQDQPGTNVNEKQSLDYAIVETESKKDKIITTVAIAYRYQNEDGYIYASDRSGEKIVAKDISEFPKDEIDKFDKYAFTLTKSKDGKNFIFENVKKVK